MSLDEPASWRAARAALSSDFTPLTDQRASAAYRMTVAGNLARKGADRNWRHERADPDRSSSMPPNDVADLAAPTSVVHKPLPHDSARLHVQGSATYVDDIREPEGTLHVAIGMADKACGLLRSLDLSAVRAAAGVVAVLTAADIPGKNDIAPVFADEPLFADKEVMFHGQPLFAVVARNRDEARRAARLAKIDIEEQPPSVTVADALKTGAARSGRLCLWSRRRERGDRRGAHRFEGQLSIGGQEHFYLEGQASFAIPGEGDEMTVHASSQDPTETQHIVARVLGVPDAFVTVETRRMGGGFGGKESQACTWAAMAALAARVDGPAVQGSARPRRRLHADRQAPRFPRRLARRLSTTGASSPATT